MKFEVLVQDITTIAADAIVNTAHESLRAGGGVCGAIHKAAGKALERECIKLAKCDAGKAKHTAAYNLPAKYVIHTVGPRYSKYSPEIAAQLLAGCYISVLKIAEELGAKSVVFPAISCGIYGYPVKEAMEIACNTICACPNVHKAFDRIVFAVASKEIAAGYKKTLKMKGVEHVD